VQHDVLDSLTTLEGESVRQAHCGALALSQASTHRDAAGIISVREIGLVL